VNVVKKLNEKKKDPNQKINQRRGSSRKNTFLGALFGRSNSKTKSVISKDKNSPPKEIRESKPGDRRHMKIDTNLRNLALPGDSYSQINTPVKTN
jgi:hypothetical protein